MPLIITGNQNNLTAQVHAFHLGADDYITVPCDARFLVGRAAALLRRSYHYSQVRHMSASTQQVSSHAAHNHSSAPSDHGVTSQPQSRLPRGWATCDTCGYIGPLQKFTNSDSHSGIADIHTVLCCPNCQQEDVARFSVG
jgi:hypothetical protein